jgi:hypothetical protein
MDGGGGAASSKIESMSELSADSLAVGVSRKGLESKFDRGIGPSMKREGVGGIEDGRSDLGEALARSD